MYDAGARALSYWYKASGLALKGISFEQALAHYAEVSPTFISHFTGAVKDSRLSEGRIQTSMELLGSSGWQLFPKHATFYDALLNERATFRFEDVKEIAAKSAADVAGVVKWGAGIYLLGLGLAAAFIFFPKQSGGFLGKRARS